MHSLIRFIHPKQSLYSIELYYLTKRIKNYFFRAASVLGVDKTKM